MNAIRNAGCTFIALMLLSGCASMRDQSDVASSNAPAKPSPYDADSAYIKKVEHAAAQDNVDVRWVNPPTNRDTSSTDTSDTSSSKPR